MRCRPRSRSATRRRSGPDAVETADGGPSVDVIEATSFNTYDGYVLVTSEADIVRGGIQPAGTADTCTTETTDIVTST